MSQSKIKTHRTFKAVAILLIISICLSSTTLPVISREFLVKTTSLKNESENNVQQSECIETGSVRYDLIFGLKQHQSRLKKNTGSYSQNSINDIPKGSLYSVILTYEEAVEFEKQFVKLKEKFKEEKDLTRIKEYTDLALNLYHNYSILPDCFTYENITDFMEQFTTSYCLALSKKNSIDRKTSSNLPTPDILQANNTRRFLFNFGLPINILSFFTIFGSVNPFGVYSDQLDNKFYFIPKAIWNLSMINVTANKTGIYLDIEKIREDNFIEDLFEWPIAFPFDGPLWNWLWKDALNESYRQWKMAYLVSICYPFYLLLGNAISYGILAGPQFDTREYIVKMKDRFTGNFIYLALPWILPYGFTLYTTYPEPWTIKLDIGAVGSILACGLMASNVFIPPDTP